MYLAIALAFVIGYALIALEHTLHVDKAAAAVLTGVTCWTLLALAPELLPEAVHEGLDAGGGHGAADVLTSAVGEHVGEIAQILFFLLAAMTIVELVDAHGGFELITARITTTSRARLIWILGVVTFFLSAALDNLTTAIVMATLLRKLVADRDDLWLLGGIVVIAANAGGAWSPIGDVTTIMLWIGGQVTAANVVTALILPSLVCLAVPLAIASAMRRGHVTRPTAPDERLDAHGEHVPVTSRERALVFALGIGGLLFVPVFKTVTHHDLSGVVDPVEGRSEAEAVTAGDFGGEFGGRAVGPADEDARDHVARVDVDLEFGVTDGERAGLGGVGRSDGEEALDDGFGESPREARGQSRDEALG